jgi:CheY-like chemotaxis protein
MMVKILVVEDEWIVADQICGTLRRMGYLVPPPVPSGEAAIKKITEEKPDLVLMDILLRGAVDGIETARQINSRFDIPVIYLTAHSDQELLERIKQTKPASYLMKPFNDNELQMNIEIALQHHADEKKLKNSHDLLASNIKTTIDAITERPT